MLPLRGSCRAATEGEAPAHSRPPHMPLFASCTASPSACGASPPQGENLGSGSAEMLPPRGSCRAATEGEARNCATMVEWWRCAALPLCPCGASPPQGENLGRDSADHSMWSARGEMSAGAEGEYVSTSASLPLSRFAQRLPLRGAFGISPAQPPDSRIWDHPNPPAAPKIACPASGTSTRSANGSTSTTRAS